MVRTPRATSRTQPSEVHGALRGLGQRSQGMTVNEDSNGRHAMLGKRFTSWAIGSAMSAMGLVALPLIVASPNIAQSPLLVPSAPSAVAVLSGSRSLHVSWAESTGGVLTFLATATAPGHPSVSCLAVKDGCEIVPLSNGVIYDVTVVARDLLGSSPLSGDMTALVGVPGAPLSVKVSPGKAKVAVSWSSPKATGVGKVTGYAATAAPGGFSCSTASTLLTKAGHSCQIAGLTSGTQYTITVTASNAYGTGVPSKAMTATPS
jgi:hypothetical protein